MLKVTGPCLGGIEAIEFLEKILELIPKEKQTAEFANAYERSLNRFRYEVAKGIGKKIRINKGIKSWHKDTTLCGKCGFIVYEPTNNYCPNCGTKVIK